ncbi:hypothetical protein BV25DRAFT_1820969 [Artomyces pyxidatus]|uniref:Uncharacterized protein n=1 Tax=Artomyces pyxidatus TaxID=48021 RepID=A0ACB8TC21_9AGAM|nr:hypothetical protein BV25DRAFT_1820969 [Artomyces pyxidatus]
MKLSSAFATLLLAAVAVEASTHINPLHKRHGASRLTPARRDQTSKRCKPRVSSSVAHTSSPKPAPTSSAKPNNVAHKTSAAAAPKATSPAIQANTGLINVKSDCGNIGATEHVTATSGPNGNIDWLNCGIDNGGWNPPFVHISQLKHAELSDARHTAFSACTDEIIAKFEQYGGELGIPSIILASFAMQESTCNPGTVGGAGEQGLMQLTHDKCVDAPGGNCQDIDYNIRTGAQFFMDTLNGNGGDVFKTVGNYNGWFKGMTFGDATAAGKTGCCRCQNNLDYLQQWGNGWIQGINAYDTKFRLGKYFNLDICNKFPW